MESVLDLVVIGGGINGTGIAADAAGRGLSVLLCEQHDLASGTSSTSSKLIHGGLRYLEHYEFRLVREALKEREVLLRKAPHLVSPLKFTLPHRPHLRPAWMIRSGLFLYDHLSRSNSLPRTKQVSFSHEHPLKDSLTKGFEYYDCWVDDSRLVITNALDAQRRGAEIAVQTQCRKLRFLSDAQVWELELYDARQGSTRTVHAANVVNASGPWLNKFLEDFATTLKPKRRIRLIKGSHIVVPKTLTTEGAYILQNEDKRIVFVLPYQEDFSIIGTTDKEYFGAPEDVSIEDWEVDYLLNIYNQHFKEPLVRKDIVSSYSGVRPLCDDESDDPSAITRDYTLELHAPGKNAALLSVYGGKITTFRKLAEAALKALQPYMKNDTKGWTNASPMPGAAHFGQSRDEIRSEITQRFPWLDFRSIERFTNSYGLLCFEFLRNTSKKEDLGEDFGAGLTRAEVDYLMDHEWARTAEDILWRRSKLGLRLSESEAGKLESYVRKRFNANGEPVVKLVN